MENCWSWNVFGGWYQKEKFPLTHALLCTLVHCSNNFHPVSLSNFTLEIIVHPTSCAHILHAGKLEASWSSTQEPVEFKIYFFSTGKTIISCFSVVYWETSILLQINLIKAQRSVVVMRKAEWSENSFFYLKTKLNVHSIPIIHTVE